MATVYTHSIISEEGISFEKFVLDCAKAFGACISMRNEDPSVEIPDEFTVPTYNLDRIKESEKELEDFKKLTPEYWDNFSVQEFKNQLERYEIENKKNTRNQERYSNMILKVKAWNPPTAEHEGLKKFMQQQLLDSKEWDDYTPDYPKKISGEEWMNSKLESILKSIEYNTKSYRKEVEGVAGRNLWIKQLRESLKENK